MNTAVAEPTAAQKSAGNYPKHHVNVRGLRISIENAAGSTRSGKDREGTEWSQEMKNHYGYIRGTLGKDKDHIDVFLGPEPHAAHHVHIVNQVNEDGDFDEHKVMLGFPDKQSAVDAYHANYEEGWRGADTVATMPFPKFRQWATGARRIAPARDAGKVDAPPPEGFKRGGAIGCGAKPGYASGGFAPGYSRGGSLTPLTGLGGYMYEAPSRVRVLAPTPNALSFTGTQNLIDTGSASGGYDNAGSSPAGAPASGGLSPGTIGMGLGIAGQLAGSQELGMLGGAVGAAGAAQQGNFGPAGSFVGGLMGGAPGALAGGLLGGYASNTLSGASVANSVLGMAVPGYGLANALSGGLLGGGLFGTNGSWSPSGVRTPAKGGLFGDWGLTAGQTAANAANALAARENIDPMDALMAGTGAFGTALGPTQNTQTGAFGYSSTGTEGGGFTDAGGLGSAAAADAAEGGYLKRGGLVRRYADGGSVAPAYVGYRSAGRRRESNNDREAAKNAPLSALRGWAAGTLGLPGDIEGLGRMALGAVTAPDSYVGRNMGATPALPTSEFYNEWLPGRAEGASNRAFEGLGNLFGGAGATTAARPLAKSAPIVRQGALRAFENAQAPTRLSPQAGVFKAPGGNWSRAPGSLQDILDRADLSDSAYKWAQGPFTKYVENDFGTLRDPLRAQATRREGILAELGARAEQLRSGSHAKFAPDTAYLRYDENAEELVHRWSPKEEVLQLAEFSSAPAARTVAELERAEPGAYKAHLWLDKAAPNTPMYAPDGDLAAGEFGHMFDYVNAATKSGVAMKTYGGLGGLERAAAADPQLQDALELARRNLHVDPDKLNAFDVPTASLKTAEWDKHLQGAKQTAELSKGIKSVLKTYPDSGHQWVELAPEGLEAEGQAMKHCVGGYCSAVEDGSTRIISLRDKAGKPKVTIEVDGQRNFDGDALPTDMRDLRGLTDAEFRKLRAANGDSAYFESGDTERFIRKTLGAKRAESLLFGQGLPNIHQIKGAANRAPSADVLPMVQDFIRGTDIPGFETFNTIADLKNTGLKAVIDAKTGFSKYLSEAEFKAWKEMK